MMDGNLTKIGRARDYFLWLFDAINHPRGQLCVEFKFSPGSFLWASTSWEELSTSRRLAHFFLLQIFYDLQTVCQKKLRQMILLAKKIPDNTLLTTNHDGDKVINGLLLTSTLSHLA